MTGLLDRTADEVMTKAPRTVLEAAMAKQALAIMNEAKITCLFVTGARDEVTGILHIHDCLRAGVV